MLTFHDFAVINRRRCEAKEGFNHKLSSWSLSDWMTATVGELGEAANIAKKLNRIRDGIPGNDKSGPELWVDLLDEFADVFIYLDLMCQAQGLLIGQPGLELEGMVRRKFNATSKKINCSIVIPESL